MDPALLAFILKAAPLVLEAVDNGFKVKDAIASEDEAVVEAAYRDLTAQRNALSDRLRSTPEDRL